MFPHLFAMGTLVLTSGAVVNKVIIKMSSQEQCNLIVNLALVSAGYEDLMYVLF